MIGELTKGACSMFGANSTATPDGTLLQLRALDWNVDGKKTDFMFYKMFENNIIRSF